MGGSAEAALQVFHAVQREDRGPRGFGDGLGAEARQVRLFDRAWGLGFGVWGLGFGV